jgi:hypothetical protein
MWHAQYCDGPAGFDHLTHCRGDFDGCRVGRKMQWDTDGKVPVRALLGRIEIAAAVEQHHDVIVDVDGFR